MVFQACLEQGANVDTVVSIDFGVAEYAVCIARGSQILELDFFCSSSRDIIDLFGVGG